MKKVIYILWITLILASAGCSDNDKVLSLVTPETTGTLTDNEGNAYTWVRYNGLDWMASNFRAGKPYYDTKNMWGKDQIGFDSKVQAMADYEMYGNLYTHAEALANAPEGWRLPTDEDWKKLEQALGMSEKTSDQIGWRGDNEGVLIQQDEAGSGIHLLLGGYVSIRYFQHYFRQIREYGYYWSSTIDESTPQPTVAFYRRICFNSSKIERNVITLEEKSTSGTIYQRYMSVRYVRDAK